METYNKQYLRFRYKNQSGQSLFEVVISMALISIVLITLVAMAALSIRAAVFSRNQTQAGRLTEQASEWLRSEKDASWSTFNTHAATINWCLDSLYWQKAVSCSPSDLVSGTNFIRSVKFTRNADGSIVADVNTNWIDAQGTHTVTASTVFTNWQADFIVITPPPTPPAASWHVLGSFVSRCNTVLAIGPLLASQFSIKMTAGGGGDGRISYGPNYGSGGAKWLVNGVYQPTTPLQQTMNVGQTYVTAVFVQGTATQQSISVGCNDGESATMSVSYFGP